ncbi:MAG: hypothetical protein OES79_01510 [Planctomycetota bacterium]|nr:hypothetical protein [Planctomycetota bacterium]
MNAELRARYCASHVEQLPQLHGAEGRHKGGGHFNQPQGGQETVGSGLPQ